MITLLFRYHPSIEWWAPNYETLVLHQHLCALITAWSAGGFRPAIGSAVRVTGITHPTGIPGFRGQIAWFVYPKCHGLLSPFRPVYGQSQGGEGCRRGTIDCRLRRKVGCNWRNARKRWRQGRKQRTITITNSFLAAIRNVNEAVFLNDAGAEISIDNAGLHGITNENDGQFTNKGSILLKNITAHGIANDGSTSSLQDTRFVNEATITMENTIGAHGVYNYLGYFVNTGGTISIDGSGAVSATERDGIRTFGAEYQLFNSGTIILGNEIGGDGIHIASYFHNFTIGRIEINNAGPPNLPNSYGAAIAVMDTLVNDGKYQDTEQQQWCWLSGIQ